MLNIPPHWKSAKLGEVANYLNGRAFKPIEWEKSGLPIIRIQNLNKSDAEYNYSNKIFEDRYLVKKGDLLFAWSASLGAYIWRNNDAWLNQHIFKVVPKNNTELSFLYYLLNKIVAELYAKTHGSGMVHITKGKFESTLIPLPPLHEQHLIVAKIEELFSELDNAVENLKKAKEQLKVFRQAVLKWAYEGKLTEEWRKERESQNTKYQSEKEEVRMAAEEAIKYSFTNELPVGWKWVKFNDVCIKIGDVDHRMPKSIESGFPYVMTKDLSDDLKISFESVKYISEADYEILSRKIKPEKGDIIFPRYGTIGKNVLVETDKPFLVSYSCAIIKPDNSKVTSKFIYLYTLSPLVTKEIRKYIVETTQANIGISSIKQFVLPLTTIEEQDQIVQEIETRFSVADKLEQSIDQSLQQSEALRQSILKRAFEGRLVSTHALPSLEGPGVGTPLPGGAGGGSNTIKKSIP
jgi:type I restriction enzyme S subunit